MARRAGTTRTAASSPTGRPRGRPPGSKSGKRAAIPPAGKGRQPAAVRSSSVIARRTVAAAPAAPKVSKDELRAQVEKLQRTVDTLRGRSREAVRAAKQAATRIAELEAQVAAARKTRPDPAPAATRAATRAPKRTVAAAAAPPKVARPIRGRRLSAERDPGDAVPPGVAVRDPEPMDEEAAAAFESLGAKLHPAT